MSSELPYEINLVDNGEVVTNDGEVLGHWSTDDSDALYLFTPLGAAGAASVSAWVWELCEFIRAWRATRP